MLEQKEPWKFDIYPPYRTGLAKFENAVGVEGLQPGNIIVLAGNPGCAKTALATNLAYSLQDLNNLRVLIISMEMSREMIILRIMSEQTGFGLSHCRRIVADDPDQGFITRLVEEYGETATRHHIEKLKSFRDSLIASHNLTVVDDGCDVVKELMEVEFINSDPNSERRKLSENTLNMIFQSDFDVIVVDYFQMMAIFSPEHHKNLEVLAEMIRRKAREHRKFVIMLSETSGDANDPRLRSAVKLSQMSTLTLFMSPKQKVDDYESKIPIFTSKSRYSDNADFELRFMHRSTRFANSRDENWHSRDLEQSKEWLIN